MRCHTRYPLPHRVYRRGRLQRKGATVALQTSIPVAFALPLLPLYLHRASALLLGLGAPLRHLQGSRLAMVAEWTHQPGRTSRGLSRSPSYSAYGV